MAEAVATALAVQVVWQAQGQVHERGVSLAPGATIADALQTCGLTLGVSQTCGVWGRVRDLDWPLQAGDRVEVYWPLKVDPKVARRERFAQQGARTSGLFASRRPNSKAGY